MGSWSAALTQPFLRFAALQQPATLLDIGSGTGNLLAAAAALFPAAKLVGIDPSAALLSRARARPELRNAVLIKGRAERLPFAGATFDGCLSLLVLQEFPDPLETLREMRRVTCIGGVVAACQWDFPRMPVIATLVNAIAAVDPREGERLATRSPNLISGEADLAEAWHRAGLREITASRIEVVREYQNFDDLWHSLLGGSTPSTLTLTTLSGDKQETVRHMMQSRFAVAPATAGFEVAAEALVVRGRP